jgi:hypothetical protein
VIYLHVVCPHPIFTTLPLPCSPPLPQASIKTELLNALLSEQQRSVLFKVSGQGGPSAGADTDTDQYSCRARSSAWGALASRWPASSSGRCAPLALHPCLGSGSSPEGLVTRSKTGLQRQWGEQASRTTQDAVLHRHGRCMEASWTPAAAAPAGAAALPCWPPSTALYVLVIYN